MCSISNPDFVIYSSVVSFYLPFIVTLLVYIRIYVFLRMRRKRITFSQASGKVQPGSTPPSVVRLYLFICFLCFTFNESWYALLCRFPLNKSELKLQSLSPGNSGCHQPFSCDGMKPKNIHYSKAQFTAAVSTPHKLVQGLFFKRTCSMHIYTFGIRHTHTVCTHLTNKWLSSLTCNHNDANCAERKHHLFALIKADVHEFL